MKLTPKQLKQKAQDLLMEQIAKVGIGGDYDEFVIFSNAPALEPGDRCAILCFSRKRNYTEVHTMVFEKTMRFTEQSKEDTMPSIIRILRN